MKAPHRLIDGDDPLVASMLRAAKNEAPRPSAVGTALGVVASSGAVGPSGFAAGLGAMPLLKSAVIGALTGVAALGASQASSSDAMKTKAVASAAPARAVAPSTTRSRAAVAAGNHGAAGVATSLEPPPAPRAETAEQNSMVPNVRRRTNSSDARAQQPSLSQPSAEESQLQEEVAIIDRARRALALGDAGATLTELRAHSQRFTGGALEPEAQYLRMEAHLLSGDARTAELHARAVLRTHPNGVHAKRARQILSSLE